MRLKAVTAIAGAPSLGQEVVTNIALVPELVPGTKVEEKETKNVRPPKMEPT